jgi:hypothetical protein
VEDAHGDPNSITLYTLKRAASAAGISVEVVVANIQRGLQPGGGKTDQETVGTRDVEDEPVVTEAHGSVM